VAFVTRRLYHARAPDVIVGTVALIALPFLALGKSDPV
jgi:hypothetical protein